MGLRELHVHTVFSDGENTPEEVALAAIAKGVTTLGFSDHSFTAFDTRYCMQRDYGSYRAEIARLREKYRGQIEILTGIEQDYYAADSAEGFDYVIGSVHYLRVPGGYAPVDDDPKTLLDAVNTCFGGDFCALAECYFETAADVVRRTGATIIGHFDLVSKFRDTVPLPGIDSPRYTAAWQRAVDRLLPFGVPFEVNHGAIARGLRKTPYPTPEMQAYILSHGGTLLPSSDSHRADTLCFFANR